MTKFNPCRFCRRTDQEFAPEILECGSMEERKYFLEDVRVVCRCNNQTLIGSDSFDKALLLWNEENPTVENEMHTLKICKNCIHRYKDILECGLHDKKILADYTCDDWLGW